MLFRASLGMGLALAAAPAVFAQISPPGWIGGTGVFPSADPAWDHRFSDVGVYADGATAEDHAYVSPTGVFYRPGPTYASGFRVYKVARWDGSGEGWRPFDGADASTAGLAMPGRGYFRMSFAADGTPQYASMVRLGTASTYILTRWTGAGWQEAATLGTGFLSFKGIPDGSGIVARIDGGVSGGTPVVEGRFLLVRYPASTSGTVVGTTLPPYKMKSSAAHGNLLNAQAQAYGFDAQSRLVVAFRGDNSFVNVARLEGSTWTTLVDSVGTGDGSPGVTRLAVSRAGDLYLYGGFSRVGAVATPGGSAVVASDGQATPLGTRTAIGRPNVFETDAGVLTCTSTKTDVTCANATTGTAKTAAVKPGFDVSGTGTTVATGFFARPDGKVYVVSPYGYLGGAGGPMYSGAFLFDPVSGETSAPAGPRGNGLVGGELQALQALPDGSMAAVGSFTYGGNVRLNGAGRWNGAVWEPLGTGLTASSSPVSTAAMPAGFAVAGASASGPTRFPFGLGRWDGSAWGALPLASDTGTKPAFGTAALVAADGVDLLVAGALYDASFAALPILRRSAAGAWSALPAFPGTNATVAALAADQGRVAAYASSLVGSAFVSALYLLDPGATAWRSVATNATVLTSYNNAVMRLLFHRGQLVVAAMVKYPPATAWHSMALVDVTTGTASPVPGLEPLATISTAVSRPDGLYASGVSPTGLNRLTARWDGTAWSAIDSSGVSASDVIRVMGSTPDALWIGGFGRRICGGHLAYNVCRYVPDGTAVGAEEHDRPAGSDDRLRAFPQPFAERTTLAFALDAPSTVRLGVYDLLGRRVATLVDGTLPAGEHRVALNGAGLAVGTYVAVLDTPLGRTTRLLVRR